MCAGDLPLYSPNCVVFYSILYANVVTIVTFNYLSPLISLVIVLS